MRDVDEPDLESVWRESVATLSPGAKVFVYAAKPLSLHNGILIVAVQDDLSRAQLESRVRPALEQSLTTQAGQDIRLVVTIDPEIIDEPDPVVTVSTAPGEPEIDSSTSRFVDKDDDFEEDDDTLTPSWVS